MKFEDHPVLKCGCVAVAKNMKDSSPYCIVHDCAEIAEQQPDLTGRIARCVYYGQSISKNRWHNSSCCNKCNARIDGICHCEEPSSRDLWFFEYKPEESYDRFYCACRGAD